MKARKKMIIITVIVFSGLIIIPAIISFGSTFYCSSFPSEDCTVYSISFIPNFRPALEEAMWENDSQRQYETSPTTCNDFLGKPDVECFVKSFQECKHASIKNMLPTMEGDPVYFYAYIDVDDCLARYIIDLRQDRFAGIDNKIFDTSVCRDVSLENDTLFFQCEGEKRIFQRR